MGDGALTVAARLGAIEAGLLDRVDTIVERGVVGIEDAGEIARLLEAVQRARALQAQDAPPSGLDTEAIGQAVWLESQELGLATGTSDELAGRVRARLGGRPA